MLFRRSPANAPHTINDDARTVEAVLSTGAIVQRNDVWDGVYDEELVISEEAVDLSRLQDAPLFLDHRHRDSHSIVGRVERAWIAGGKLTARLRFSAEEPGATAFRKVQEGTFKAVSVGYRVDRRETKDRDGNVPLVRAVRWTPFEASLVGIGADAGARVRSAVAVDHADDSDDWQEPPIAPTARRMPERRRREEIAMLCRTAGVSQEIAADFIARGAGLDEVRVAMFDELHRRSLVGGEIQPWTRACQDGAGDPAERQAIVDALAHRLNPSLPLSEHARQFRGLPPLKLMELRLDAVGERSRRLGRDELIERSYHGASDFPALLTESGNRALLAAYDAAPAPLKVAARQRPGNAPDFRPLATLRLGEHPKLLKVNEGGEVTYGTIAESKQSYSISTFARIFALTRQALINDDLGAFSDFLTKGAASAAEVEAEQLAALLSANSGNGATMADNKALFHADHANKAGAGGAPDVTTLGAARQAMREQKGLDGTTPINVVPKFIQVGPALETTAEQLLATLYPAQASDVNPFSGKLQLLVEPRLAGNAWRLFADPVTMPVIEYAYLSDAPGPQLVAEHGFDIMGTKWRISLDFGCGLLDHRGAYLNQGG
ncbi:MAG: hypothetical protein BroJett029_26970 [Alphaproteobacteria bacterium]|nr:MAG: hypothetical protein BroJett029_26970 [Alphaproteobacteria bacterium]